MGTCVAHNDHSFAKRSKLPNGPKYCNSVCGPFRVRKDGHAIDGSRHELVIYRPRTVWVMTPQTFQSHMRVIWNGELVRQAAVTRMSGVVKIDDAHYVTHGGNLYRGGTCVRQFALHLDEEHLRKIYELQQRNV